jgi:hypothetical protein
MGLRLTLDAHQTTGRLRTKPRLTVKLRDVYAPDKGKHAVLNIGVIRQLQTFGDAENEGDISWHLLR